MMYLDNNATTAIKPQVKKAVLEAMEHSPLNPSSVHASGRAARKIIDNARAKIAEVFGAGGADIIFTGSGTEANNLAVSGVKGYEVIVSATEHSSVLKAAKNARILPVEENGLVNLAELKKVLDSCHSREGGNPYSRDGEVLAVEDRPVAMDSRLRGNDTSVLVSIMLANNETGVIQPIKEIAALVHSYGGIIHTDAVQAVGKISVDMADLGVDMLSISAHKFGGSQGVGALIMRKGITISPMIVGGGQELSLRAGTENVAAIAGFGSAVENLQENLDKAEEIKILRDYMEERIKSIVSARVFGEGAARLPNTSCFTMPGVKSEVQVIEFDLAGIAVSSGSACSSGKVAASHVLQAMGVAKPEAETAIRISLGINNTKVEIDKFIEVWRGLYNRANQRNAA